MTVCMSNVGKRSAPLAIEGYSGPLALRIGGTRDYFSVLGPVVALRGSRSIIAQIQNTFDRQLFLTPFGEKPGTLQVTVLAAPECGEDTSTPTGDFVTFFTQKQFKGGPPLTIAIGNGVLRGVLFGSEFGIEEKTQYATTTFTFVIWATSTQGISTVGGV